MAAAFLAPIISCMKKEDTLFLMWRYANLWRPKTEFAVSQAGVRTPNTARAFSGTSGWQCAKHHGSVCPFACILSMMYLMDGVCQARRQRRVAAVLLRKLPQVACIIVHYHRELRNVWQELCDVKIALRYAFHPR